MIRLPGFNSFLIYLLLHLLSSESETSQMCSTPDGRVGECRYLEDCNSIMKRRCPTELCFTDEEQLANSQCYISGDRLRVCCFKYRTKRDLLSKALIPRVLVKKSKRGKHEYEELEHPNRHLLDDRICGQTDEQPRIFGGYEAHPKQYPWMALLKYEVDEELPFLCGGSLINRRYVLTAAHCILPTLVSVRLGEYDLTDDVNCTTEADPCIDVGIEQTVVHEYYRSKFKRNDIALIRLNKLVKITDFISPLCLPYEKEELTNFTGQEMTVSGWGLTEKGFRSNIKMWVKLPVTSRCRCQTAYKFYQVTDGQICAGGEEGKDSCNGDSGGALMFKDNGTMKWVMAGIVSTGQDTCGSKGIPGIYTRAEYYVHWVLDHLKP